MPRTLPIRYPDRPSEFEVQATLWRMLIDEGIDVRGNVPGVCGEWKRTRKCYFDLVIFSRLKRPVIIIECKNKDESTPIHVLSGRQKYRYEKFEHQILVCDRMSKVPDCYQEIVEILDQVPFA